MTASTLLPYLVTRMANKYRNSLHCTDVGPNAGLSAINHFSLSKPVKALDYPIMKQANLWAHCGQVESSSTTYMLKESATFEDYIRQGESWSHYIDRKIYGKSILLYKC